ncbi:hypothetical protein Tco_1173662 [Tanacetum coccineum]
MNMTRFWSEVLAYFENKIGEKIRGYDAIIVKWKILIRPRIAAFNGVYDKVKRMDEIIMVYFVKISKKARILELKRRNLKNIVLIFNTPYSSRKMRRIRACTSQETTKTYIKSR